MLNDEPTLPNLPDDVLTQVDLRRLPPAWPIPAERSARLLPDERGRRRAGRRRSSLGWVYIIALGAGASVLLSLLSVLALISHSGHASVVSPHTPITQSSPATSAADPTNTPAAVSDWLQIAPTSVQFGCADHQRTQIVVLENHGSRQVHWQASDPIPADQSAVIVSPENGDLGPGESTALQLQSTTNSTRQQELIRFTPTDSEAGSPTTLTVTVVGCN